MEGIEPESDNPRNLPSRKEEEYYFLTNEEARFFSTLSGLIVPGKEGEPGAKDVGGLSYIDSALLDLPKIVQDYYSGAIKALNFLSHSKFGNRFPELQKSEQNAALREFFLDQKTREMMFDLRSIVLESFYSDYHAPWYEGKTGWEFTGFSGKRISDLKKDWTFLRVWKDSTTSSAENKS